MLKVRVEIPFHLNETNKTYSVGTKIKISEETFDRIKAVNVNMVSVLEKIAEDPPPDDPPPDDIPPAETKTEKSEKTE